MSGGAINAPILSRLEESIKQAEKAHSFIHLRISPLPCGLFRFLAVAEMRYRSLGKSSIENKKRIVFMHEFDHV